MDVVSTEQLLLESFWNKQMEEAEQAKKPILSLSQIKKIIKANKDVRMVASEVPILIAKACEMFISDLSLRAWKHTEANKRIVLQPKYIGAAISETEVYNFLADKVSIQQDNTRNMRSTKPQVDSSAENVQHQYVTQHYQGGSSGTSFNSSQYQIGPFGETFYACGQQPPLPSQCMTWVQAQRPPPSQEDLSALYALAAAAADAEPEEIITKRS